MTTCHRCKQPSVVSVNGLETCSDHFNATMDWMIDSLAMERGIPLNKARSAFAKLFRQAMREQGNPND